MINNRCDYFSKQWIGGPFVAMLRLTPVKKGASIPSSFFTKMPVRKRNDRRARWIKRGKLKSWTFIVLYHLSRSQTFVEYIVVKAVYPSSYVDPHVLNKSVKQVLGSIWKIDVENTSVPLRVEFNNYIRYQLLLKDLLVYIGINVSKDIGYVPQYVGCNLRRGKVDVLDEILFPVVSEFDVYLLQKGFFVTELFFCDQVDLLPEEFTISVTCLNTIHFHVKNITIHRFSLIPANDATLLIGIDETNTNFDKQTVRICAHEFEQNRSVGSVVTVHVLGLFVTLTVTMYFAYMILYYVICL